VRLLPPGDERLTERAPDRLTSVQPQVPRPQWRKQFAGKRASDPVELNRDIQNISGATLSCRHVTEGVKRLLAIHKSIARR